MLKTRVFMTAAAAALALSTSLVQAQAPAESVLVLRADVAGLVQSSLYKDLVAQFGDKMASTDANYLKFKEATGFNAETDLKSFTMGLAGDLGGAAPPKVYLIAEGTFHQSKMEEFAKTSDKMTVGSAEGLVTFTSKDEGQAMTMALLNDSTMVVASAEDFAGVAAAVKGGTGLPMAAAVKAGMDQVKGQVGMALILPPTAKDQMKANPQTAPLASLQTVMLGVDVSSDVSVSLSAATDSDANGKAVYDVLNGFLAMGKMAMAENVDAKKVMDELKLEQQGANTVLTLKVKAEDVTKAIATSMNGPAAGGATEEKPADGAEEESTEGGE